MQIMREAMPRSLGVWGIRRNFKRAPGAQDPQRTMVTGCEAVTLNFRNYILDIPNQK
jgi:hypothetical protein